ncbi:MAG: acetyl-CoA carboxylase biotin carboxyl carrier protein [Elusimicrobia bacterium]|nr:acetyl-CoA carboxylase biotin carboxyl carrier protein [Elusimicrobiota bacterium]
MEIDKIKLILEAIKDTDIEEIWMEKDGEKSGFKRKDISAEPVLATKSVNSVVQNNSQSKSVQPVPSEINNIIKSTMVGTFLRTSSPGGKPLVDEGDFVTVGQKVCIVEAMKLMKEITSSIAGKVVKILVEDNHPVEYGQPLFELEPQIPADKKE